MNKSFKELVLLLMIAAGLLFVVIHWQMMWQMVAGLYDVFASFLLGGMIAFVLNVPLVICERYLEKITWIKSRVKRPLAIVCVLLLLSVLLVLVGWVVYPALQKTIIQLTSMTTLDVSDMVKNLGERFGVESTYLNDMTDMINANNAFAHVGGFVSRLTSTVTGLFSGLLHVIIGIVFAVYMLLEKEQLMQQATKVFYAFVPKYADRLIAVGHLLNTTYAQFLTGQCVEAVIIAVLLSVVLSLFSIPYAIMIGVLAGVLSFIPYIGSLIACGIGALFIVAIDPMTAVCYIVIFLIIQQIEGQVIYPKVVGQSVGLPPLYTLAASIIGGNLFGMIGMIFFIPLVAVLYQLLKIEIDKRLNA